MYAADRHVKSHGAAAKPMRGTMGLVAACAFAKDILNAFLAGPRESRETTSATSHWRPMADEPSDCARLKYAALASLKAAIEADDMVLSDGKYQVSSITKAVRGAWEARGAQRSERS